MEKLLGVKSSAFLQQALFSSDIKSATGSNSHNEISCGRSGAAAQAEMFVSDEVLTGLLE